MRKRSVKVRYIFFGGIVFFFMLAFFTRVLVPFEEFLLRVASSVLLGYQNAADSIGNGSGMRSDSSLVRVISKRADEFQDVFLISRSAPAGTKVLSGDVLVGFVVLQASQSSKVRSITSPFFKINGVISRSGIPVELEGRGALLLEGHLPRGSDVQKGDTIYHDEGDALSLGAVARIIDVASNPFITIFVLNPVNLTTLQAVELLTR